MIYVTGNFKKQYQKLSTEFKNKINQIVDKINSIKPQEYPNYLLSLCGENGNAKWSGINKTLYHLYPQGQNSVHRLFYCYATDLNNELREKIEIYDNGIIFIDYTTNHDEGIKAARKYEKSVIGSLAEFRLTKCDNSDKINFKSPVFWFCMSQRQNEVLKLPQPSLVKGSAGTGKTIISYELLKKWITSDDKKKILYLTYTANLLKKAKDDLDEDGLDMDDSNVKITNFMALDFEDKKTIISEERARNIIVTIVNSYKQNKKLTDNILFTDYFVYAYIRGLMKGRVEEISDEVLDYSSAAAYLENQLTNEKLNIQEKSKLQKFLLDLLGNENLSAKDHLKKLIDFNSSHKNKKDKEVFSNKIRNICSEEFLNKLNKFRIKKTKYEFINEEKIVKELKNNSISEVNIKHLLEIREKYDKNLEENNLYDDNDYAKYLLNLEILEDDKFDGIIVDEVQDLTESQIEAIIKLSKKSSNDISFFGDPNQTINPTVYDYGRFNSYVYKEKNKINRVNLKVTHRCGPNLLEYINYLAKLREEFKLTTNREDIEPEESANKNKIDTYWACLVEDFDTIDFVLETFTNSIDCYLIVDNEEVKQQVIKRVQRITSDYDPSIEDQIITVQNSKGLESKNVIIYNLISDNLDIFENLKTENKRVSTMTFNKLYVAATRAEDSIIFCEERIKEKPQLKKELFYHNEVSMVESVSSDDIHSYLISSNDPQKFLEQSQKLLEEKEYEKAQKKCYIAIRNVVNQFKDDEQFNLLIKEISKNDELAKIFNEYNPRCDSEIKEFSLLYNKVLDYLECDFNNSEFALLKERKEILLATIRIKDICQTILEYEILQSDLQDSNIQNDYIEKFIFLQNDDCALRVVKDIRSEPLKEALTKIVKYLFGYMSYEEALNSFKIVDFSNENFYKRILDNNVIKDSQSVLQNIKKELGEMING